ncbi:AAA family ATPase [Streptomyces actuosus]|uniref:AAA family ATPase n=1 Tax=Streptomyces actuosus TaxID=1885 RepID=A0ABS2VY00_STRAS|nr:LuxR family transcriptional regulator [Streptomyces actuosus]MBN0048018.1 AAA family ATPase [Streptomyces actuosus]
MAGQPEQIAETSALIGRTHELARFERLLDMLCAGRGQVLGISGDPGIGKTRLAAELAARARTRGVRVLTGRASELVTGSAPLQVLADTLADALATDRDALPPDVTRALLASAGPAPRADAPDAPRIPEAPRSPEAPDRPEVPRGAADPGGPEGFRLHAGLREVLTRWSRAQPLLLLLDDLHWADAETIEQVCHLIRHQPAGPVLLVVVHRPRQTSPRLLAALAHGEETGTVEPMPVGALSRPDCTDLAALLGRLADADLLHRASGGNPLFLIALARPGSSLARGSADTPDPAGGSDTSDPAASADTACGTGIPLTVPLGPPFTDLLPDGPPGDTLLPALSAPRTAGHGVPDRLAALLLGEIAVLAPEHRRVASAAAVLGDRFSVEPLAAVADLPVDTTLRAVAALASRDIVRPLDGDTQFAFRHPVLRRLVHADTDPMWRRAAHRRAYAELTRRGAPAADRAPHAEHCPGDRDPGVLDVLEEAAVQARDSAPATAAHWLRAALRALPDTPSTAAHRHRLRLELTRALAVSGRSAESRALLHDLLGDSAPDPATVALCARTERMLGRYAEADALLRQALADTGGTVTPLTAPLHLEFGTVALMRGAFHDALPAVEDVTRIAVREGDRLTEAGARALTGFGNAYLGRTHAADDALSRARLLLDALPDTGIVRDPESLAQLAWGELLTGRSADAARHLRRGVDLTRRAGHLPVLFHLQLGLGCLHLWAGALADARRATEESVRCARRLGSGDMLRMALAQQAGIAVWQGGRQAAGRAVALAERAMTAPDTEPGSWWHRSAAAMLGQAQLMDGRAQECITTLLTAGDGPELPAMQAALRPMLFSLLSGAAMATRDTDAAREWAERAVDQADRLAQPAQRAFAQRALGLVCAANGRTRQAARLLGSAAELFRIAGRPVQQAWTLVLGAPVQGAVAGADQGESWLRSAADLGTRTGSLRLQEEAAARLAARPAEAGRSLHALTARERQICDLVATGARTRDVAEQLHLSPRTVEAHLAKSYRKLGVTSRTALAAVVLSSSGRG